jgi:hypothetical protein
MKNITTFIAIVSCLILARPSFGDSFELSLNSLPSAQGWTYFTTNTSIPESNIFSADSVKLTQNSINAGPGYFSYHKYNTINPAFPFTINVRARILQEEEYPPGNRNLGAFGFYAEIGTEFYGTILRPGIIQDISERILSTTIDNTVFHNYVMSIIPGVGYQVFVDDILIASGAGVLSSEPNRLSMGDGTFNVSSKAEVTRYAFQQNIAPEPSTSLLMLLGLVGILTTISSNSLSKTISPK